MRTSKNRLCKDGTAQVLLYYHHHSTVYFPTKVWVKPRHWSKKHRMVTDQCDNGDPVYLNQHIREMQKELNDMITEYRFKNLDLPTGDQLYSLYRESHFKPIITNSYQFVGVFWSWISNQRLTKSKGSIEIYAQTLKYLSEFVGYEMLPGEIVYRNYTFASLEDVNLTFLTKFRDWLAGKTSRSTKRSLSNTTINKQIRIIQQFLRDKIRAGETVSNDAFTLKLDSKPSTREFLTEAEVNAVLNLDIEGINADGITHRRKKTLNWVRDIFTFNVEYGLRVQDLFRLKKQNIRISDDPTGDNYILLITQKTDQPIKLPIVRKKIKEILKHYLSNESSEYLFPRLSVVSYNQNLKLLCKYAGMTYLVPAPIYSNGRRIMREVPKWQLISSHGIRKTSINKNILDYGRDMAKYLSGHKSEGGFKPYEDMSDFQKIYEKALRAAKSLEEGG